MEPPVTDFEGWQVFGPGGGSGTVTNLSVSFSSAEPLSSEEINEILSTSGGPYALSFDIGLSTDLPAASTDMIAELARALDYNWLLCYIFVRNNIRFIPSAGIVRGPVRTLIDREGNSADQSFLLLALLRASGYYATIFYDRYFYMPLANASNGYDAASWLGVSPTGTVAEIKQRLNNILEPSGLYPYFNTNSTPETSILFLDHYFVGINLTGYSYEPLDPSYKPRTKTPPDFSVISEMGYNRTGLLDSAGGTVTNDWFVHGISMSSLTNELQRLTTNLISSLRADIALRRAAELIGKDEIIPQDVTVDASWFHGNYYSPSFFLDQDDSEKNKARAWIQITNAVINETIWIDELADRSLWISYTNIPGYPYPGAVLHLDDVIIAQENAGSWTENDNFMIGIHHPYFDPGRKVSGLYSFERAVTNIYAIPIGFGSIDPDGMRGESARRLAYLNSSESSDWYELRSSMLHSLGQQWIYQGAMITSLLSSIGGYSYYSYFECGVVGQEINSFFDFKTGADFTSSDGSTEFHGERLFSSALEHSVLDQNNAVDQPALSTMRVIELANNTGYSICLASSNNWAAVEPMLTNYNSTVVTWMGQWIMAGQEFLLPCNGNVVLNDWSGAGFFTYGPKGSGSLLQGGIAGGEPSRPGQTDPSKVDDGNTRVKNQDGTVKETKAADPVSLCNGAALIDRTDLVVKDPSSLSWKRHYDSSQHSGNGSLGRGWNQGYDSRIVIHSDPDSFMGRDMPASCAASVVACYVINDLMSTNSAKTMATACLVSNWWADQLLNNAATVTAGGKALSYCCLPDGTYEPQPGVTAALTGAATTGFTLEERLGNTWSFSTNGVPDYVEDRSGNTTEFTYTNGTQLVSVVNDFEDQIDIEWTGDKITSVSDSAGRTLAYVYSVDGCLTGVTDVAGYTWTMNYDAEGNLLSETDPEGTVTVQNTYNGLGQVTNQLSASGNNWTFAYADGWRSWEEDPFGNKAHHGFTSEGRNAWRIDRDGAVHLFSYDSSGHMVTNIDAISRVHVSVYDNDNHLVSMTEAANTPDTRTTSFAYDAQHHLIATTNALGRVTHMSYDDSDRLAMVITPDGVSVTNSYNAHGLLTFTKTLNVSGQTLREKSNVYNGNGRLTQSTATDAGTTYYTYDSAGNVAGITDACGNSTGFSYDSRGFVTNVVNALEYNISTVFSESCRPVSSTDPLGRTTTFMWTPGGKPAAMIFDDGSIVTNVYDIADRLISVTDQRNSTIEFNLDEMGRVTNRIASTWSDYTWYDQTGVVTARQDAVGGVTEINRDWLDRPVAVTDPLDHVRLSYYDPLNSITNTVDPRGRSTGRTFDIMGRLVCTTRPSGYAENYGHDALGRTVSFTNAEGRVTTMSHDAQNRLLSTWNALGVRLYLNRYDGCGNLTNRLDGADNSTVYEYDSLNRNTSIIYVDDTTEAFTYDAVGNLTSADNGSVSNSFVYDSMNRLTGSGVKWQTSGNSKEVTYRYDLGGLVTNILLRQGSGGQVVYNVTYAYDTDGRLTSITDWNSHKFTFTHDAAGRLASLVYPNGVVGTNTYDATHKLTGWNYKKSGSTLTGRTITRDAAGIKTSESVSAGIFPNPTPPRRASNTFDAADRLTSAVVYSGTNAYNETYSYNANGALTNLVSSQSSVVSHQSSYTYDAAQRFTGCNSQLSILNYQFNIAYDALGNRVRTSNGDVVRLWVTDHADPLKRPLMETDTSGNPVRYYIWGGGTLLAVVEADGTTHYAHSDELGSIVALTDSTGAVTDQYCYGPYGENWGRTGTTDLPFHWLGSHGVYNVNGSSLHLTRHRAYDSNTTRFLSADPLGLGGGPNLYSYCLGNPLSYIDPLGLCGESVGEAALGGFIDNLRDDGLMNVSAGAYGLLRSPYDLVAGLYSIPVGVGNYLGELSVDASGTLAGTWNEIKSLPETIPGAIDNWMNDPEAIGSTIGQIGIGIGAAKVAGGMRGTAASGNALPANEGQLHHIFRDVAGHLDDTPASRRLLLDVANDAGTTLGTDRFGNVWSARTIGDGSQVWTQTRNGVIQNGGVNTTPRTFNPSTGLSGSGGN